MFTQKEIDYLKSQRLARLATVSPNGQPDAVPVGFEFDGQSFWIGGRDPARTRKVLNVRAGNDRVALVVDDLKTVDPWHPRGVRVYGRAEMVEREGRFGPGLYMHVVPEVSWSWNVEPATGKGFEVHKTVH